MRTCGLFFQEKIESPRRSFVREQRLPRLSISAHTRILSSVARTVLTQTFINTTSKTIDVALYTFPLFDGISVVGFTCTINESRVIRGVVKEKEEALKTFNDAVARGETAGLLGRHPNAIDVFRTTIGNIPPGANVKVDIVYLEELKHDAQTDSIRFTLPTSIAPRYWGHSSRDITLQEQDNVAKDAGIDITVDIEMPTGSAISSLQSPSHPIAITIGSLSAPSTDHPTRIHSPELASATLALGTTSMDKDFVLQIHAANTSDPVAILETHPTIPNQRALMTTLVPKFNLPFQRPEIVFICDRSGSMQGTKIANLRSALRLFLASLPLGIKFNICGFGGDYEFLFPNSIPYNAQSREAAMDYTDHMDADFGGTEIKDALVDTFERRDKSMNLGVFLLTDGQVMQPEAVIAQVKRYFEDSKGAIRVFTLGIGKQASHHMLEALARAGRGFAQKAGDDEKVDKKVIYMLKAAMMPHIDDYTLEVKYRTRNQESDAHSDDFELIDDISTELTSDSLPMELTAGNSGEQEGTVTVDTPMKPISLFDANFDPDTKIEDLESLVGEDQLLSMETPATIQVPCPIPPLYPSNRTSVYLILSPDEGDKIPESVVLRGTSPNGPLELEIPVTITSGGETVHQLAARKALQDLEEERSWLHVLHRENRNNPRVMLDNTYEDRFSDLVKREAVRLGVKFQVDGKWCSFVAVQDNDREERTPSTNGENKPPPAPCPSKSNLCLYLTFIFMKIRFNHLLYFVYLVILDQPLPT